MDQQLVVRVQGGDRNAFEALVVADQARLFRLAYGILRDPQLAEDATQQALLDIWRDVGRLRDPAKCGGHGAGGVAGCAAVTEGAVRDGDGGVYGTGLAAMTPEVLPTHGCTRQFPVTQLRPPAELTSSTQRGQMEATGAVSTRVPGR